MGGCRGYAAGVAGSTENEGLKEQKREEECLGRNIECICDRTAAD